MKKLVDKDLVLTEIRRLKEQYMYNSFMYQVLVKAENKIKEIKPIEIDESEDDLK